MLEITILAIKMITPIFITFIFILVFGKFVDIYIQKINRLSSSNEDEELMKKMNKVLFVPAIEREPNAYLGVGERILFFISFNSAQPVLIGS